MKMSESEYRLKVVALAKSKELSRWESVLPERGKINTASGGVSREKVLDFIKQLRELTDEKDIEVYLKTDEAIDILFSKLISRIIWNNEWPPIR